VASFTTNGSAQYRLGALGADHLEPTAVQIDRDGFDRPTAFEPSWIENPRAIEGERPGATTPRGRSRDTLQMRQRWPLR
jgi:hypothetical protein